MGLRSLRFEFLERRALLVGDITTGLVHHWAFDETSGDAAHDTVSGGTDATLLNWDAAEPKWIPGRVDGALQFNTADNAVVAMAPAMSGSYAVAFWLNVTDRSGTNPRIFSSRAGNPIVINNDNTRGVGYYRMGTSVAVADPNFPTFNTWEHYAVNFNAVTGQGTVYRNGLPVTIGDFIDSASLSSWVFGHSSDLVNTTDSFKGSLDDLRVYSRVLTDEDIAILANLGTPEPTHQDPVHHWTFDETTGFTAHDATGGADATLLNWSAAEPRWEAGPVGGALHFSTSDNAVVTPPLGTHAQWAIAFWVNITGKTGVDPRIIGPSDGRDLWSYFHLEANRSISFKSRNSFTINPDSPNYGEWEHYAINYDTIADVGTIYHNGVAVAAGYFGDNSPVQAWFIGHNRDLGNHQDTLYGLLDDLRQYDRLLTPAEIQQLVAMGDPPPPPPPDGLIHHWKFDETTGNTAQDSAGGNFGTLQNWSAGQPKWVSGHIGGAVSFNDADDLILTQSAILENQYTVAFWLNVTGDGGFNPRIAVPTDGDDWIIYNEFSNDGIGFGGSEVRDPNEPARNIWEHYAVTFDRPSSAGAVFRNGVKVDSGTFEALPATQRWIFGHNGDPEKHVDTLHGKLDDLRIYDVLLSAEQIAALANSSYVVSDAYRLSEDTKLAINTPGVLYNDVEGLGSQPLEAVLETTVLHGSLSLNSDGSFTYIPDSNYHGPDSFTYRVDDGISISEVATVSITVTPFNDPPLAGQLVADPSQLPMGVRVTGPLTEMGGYAYFAGSLDGIDWELWRSDGTPGGTTLVKDIRDGGIGSQPSQLVNVNGTLYFRADDGQRGANLWKSNGTAGGTKIVNDFGQGASFPGNFVNANGRLYFTALTESPGETVFYGPSEYRRIADSPLNVYNVPGSEFYLENFEDKLLNSPGLSADFGMVRNPSTLTDSVDEDDGAVDGDGHLGHSYLVRPGITGVTFQFDAQVLGGLPSVAGLAATGGELQISVEFFDAFGNLIYKADDDSSKLINGSTADDRFMGISHAGGISAIRVTSLGTGNSGFEVDHIHYGVIVPPAGGLTLWRTDPASDNTVLIKNLGPQGRFSAASLNETLYFTGSDTANGVELWKSDGTESGTAILKDIAAGTIGSKPRALTAINGRIYFSANNGVVGDELWMSDGTAESTSLVKDIRLGGSSSIDELTNVNGNLMFSANGSGGVELWRSDGTEQGTVQVKNIRSSSSSSTPQLLTNVNSTLFFVANDGSHGVELWKSDGTEAGTVLVKDVDPGSASANSHGLTALDDTLLFSAIDEDGYEWWSSDGTDEGTIQIGDFAAGSASSSPRDFLSIASHLVFTAEIGGNGRTLWAARHLGAAGVVVVDGRANIFGAGHNSPPGTAPGILPVQIDLPAGQHRAIHFNASGQITLDNELAGARPFYGPEGGPEASNVLGTGGISGIQASTFGFLVGVFVGATEPASPAPSALDFRGNIGFAQFSPLLNQTFFIGDGLSGIGSGQAQTFFVPEGATRLYLGVADSFDSSTNTITGSPGFYDDNGGRFVVSYELQGVPLNIAPSFSVASSIVASDEEPFTSPLMMAMPGAPDEAEQSLTFTVMAEKPELFEVQPQIDATGKLTFTPLPNIRGITTVTVSLQDDGGVLGGGDDQSNVQTFTIEITKPNPWHNSSDPGNFGNLNVNGKDGITLIDAVMVINYLNSAPPAGQGSVPASAFTAPTGVPQVGYIDVAVDGPNGNLISTLDALLVVNFLNTPNGEGESAVGGDGDQMEVSIDAMDATENLYSLLALDATQEPVRKRRR